MGDDDVITVGGSLSNRADTGRGPRLVDRPGECSRRRAPVIACGNGGPATPATEATVGAQAMESACVDAHREAAVADRGWLARWRWWASRLSGSREPADLGLAGYALGLSTGLACCILVGAGARYRPFGIYVALLSLFHTAEFAVTAIYQPHTFSFDSSMLNHSWEYGGAHALAVAEFLLESYGLSWPTWKSHWLWPLVGLTVCVLAQAMRTIAMCQAGRNFAHVIATQRAADHKLVQTGIYSIVRHPSYVGFFYWSIGTQIVLGNPICTVAFAVFAWHFFRARIPYEEHYLSIFFGREYDQYKKRVPCGIPFIKDDDRR